jgi:hypothetical protein
MFLGQKVVTVEIRDDGVNAPSCPFSDKESCEPKIESITE